MTTHETAPEGTDFAKFFSFVSRALKPLPMRPLNALIVGNNNIPEGWQYIDRPADTIDNWINLRGDYYASKWAFPRSYIKVGVMAVETAKMDELRAANPDALHAVALRFKNAMVVGAFAAGVSFDRTAEVGHELVGTRIGRDDVPAVPGLWRPEAREFIAAESAELRERTDHPRQTIPIA